MTKIGICLVVVVALTHTAVADVCVVVDEQRDTLSPEDRKAALVSFEQALAKNGVQATNENCTTTYTVYNVKLGDSITVYAYGPTGNREGRASKLDELPLVYEQIAHALLTGEAMGTGGGNVDRTNATVDQMAPRRVAADGLKYVRLGYGAVTGRNTTLGTAFGFGYRYELDSLAVDFSLFNMVWASEDSATGNTEGGVNGEIIGIGALSYQQPLANSTLYYGGRLGYGINDTYDGSTGVNYSGSGLQITGVAGYEMLRASTIRLFLELNVTAPLYTSSGSDGNGDTDKRWAPVVSLTVGIGLGHSNTVAVVNR